MPFPVSPTPGQVYQNYVWNAATDAWVRYGNVDAAGSVSAQEQMIGQAVNVTGALEAESNVDIGDTINFTNPDAYIDVPKGNVAERPSLPNLGSLRYDTDMRINTLEYKAHHTGWRTTEDNGNAGRVTSLSFNSHYSGFSFIVDDQHLFMRQGAVAVENALGPGLHRQTSRVNFPGETGKLVKAQSGGQTGYALFDNGHLWMFGGNSTGQFGIGNTSLSETPRLVAQDAADVWIRPTDAITVGTNRTYYLNTSGDLYAAGNNNNGVLGINNTTQQNSWTLVTSISSADPKIEVNQLWTFGATYPFTVIEDTTGRLWVAGYNGHGPLGTGDTTQRLVFTDVTAAWGGNWGVGATLKVYGGGGYNHGSTVARSFLTMMRENAQGERFIFTCGAGNNGALGNGGTANISTPYQVDLPEIGTNIIDYVMIGDGLPSCFALGSNGRLYRWGYNENGVLARGNTVSSPWPIGGFNDEHDTSVAEILLQQYGSQSYSGRSSLFIRHNNGRIYGVGHNASGQLGIGNVTASIQAFTQVKLPEGVNVVQIAMGGYGAAAYTVMRTEDGQLYACGYDGRNDLWGWTTVNAAIPLLFRF